MTAEPLVAVTSDGHVGPLLKKQLRDYCPPEYLEDFDAFAGRASATGEGHEPEGASQDWATFQERQKAGEGSYPLDIVARMRRNMLTDGHHDPHARLRDMDRDGVAGEVIFHFSQNDEQFPFMAAPSLLFAPSGTARELELAAVGMRIYNRWLADFVSVEPDRHVALAYLPLWDIEASIEELQWAREAGLRGVNLPAPRPGIRELDDPAWEPFWSACESLGMTLTTHAGAGDPSSWTGRHAVVMVGIESGGWPCRRGLPRMVFGGVFARHPGLKLVYTELFDQPSTWWPSTMHQYDVLWAGNRWMLGDQVPEPPSEYMRRNVFLGASSIHTAPGEAEKAVRDGYATNLLWGSDYPHIEGTYAYPDNDADEPTTRLALRYTFGGLPTNPVRMMAGENAINVYGLDHDKLRSVAARISAPTPEELTTPDSVPDHWLRLGV